MYRYLFFGLVLIGSVGAYAHYSGDVMAKPSPAQKEVTHFVQADESGLTETENANIGHTHIVEIYKMKFQAKGVNVKIGDTVTWINKDIVPHTATANDKSWDSGRLKKGESFSLTISEYTSLDYFCLYHRQMKAKITID